MYHLASVEPFDDDVSLQCAPPVISWFRFAPVTIVIGTINHSYWSYVHQLNAIWPGASHCMLLDGYPVSLKDPHEASPLFDPPVSSGDVPAMFDDTGGYHV